jgi:hypothetical protein
MMPGYARKMAAADAGCGCAPGPVLPVRVLLPPGALPPGALPPGALPPGALPPGALPPGALPPRWSGRRVVRPPMD